MIEYDGANADEIVSAFPDCEIRNGRLHAGTVSKVEVILGEAVLKDDNDDNVWIGHPSMFNKFLEEEI